MPCHPFMAGHWKQIKQQGLVYAMLSLPGKSLKIDKQAGFLLFFVIPSWLPDLSLKTDKPAGFMLRKCYPFQTNHQKQTNKQG